MKQLVQKLGLQAWQHDLQPAGPICELFDFLEDIQFWVKDGRSIYRWANLACLLNLGLRQRSDIIARTDFDFEPAQIAAQFQADDVLVMSGQRIINRIELVGRFDHTASWCVTSKLPLRNHHGQIVGTAGITRPMRNNERNWEGLPLGKVVAYLSDHYHEHVGNEQLARIAGCSERTFERRFRKHYGVSPHQYLKRLRIQMACQALVYTDHSISFIAVEHGFPDQSYFTHEFREMLGRTPSEYRKSFCQEPRRFSNKD